jgi:hypothetical protein
MREEKQVVGYSHCHSGTSRFSQSKLHLLSLTY